MRLAMSAFSYVAADAGAGDLLCRLHLKGSSLVVTPGKLTDTSGCNVAWSRLVADLNATRVFTALFN